MNLTSKVSPGYGSEKSQKFVVFVELELEIGAWFKNLIVHCILETKSFRKASNMAKHQPDLIMCRKQPGIAIGRLCEKDDGKCVICDSLVHPCTLVRICDECNYGSFQGRCVICGGVGISDAYYCKECTQLEKDRDGCPKIVNLGSAKTDLFYEGKKYGFKKR
ncbi:hypothetical protein DKX38_014096 [Salix brachista]|uniref:PHD finger-like domain-containing protein 5A n=1 Tax=Salix brachista TaxID=2182728 RepID=A0A5N5LET3_9ROSI|nr:hypothetical protein DKX38_014096 [Salix brachista]